jgi:uncharacterized membrane protein YqgA involved in biofilm formation
MPGERVSVHLMIGTVLNAAAIVVGGAIGLATSKGLSAVTQSRLKILLGAFTVYAGLSMAWDGFSGSLWHRAAQLGIAIVAMSAGKLTGRLVHLQRAMNKGGQLAQRKFAQAKSAPNRPGEGFVTCTLLFCLGPMAILGALQDGLLGSFRTLAVKSVLDGLATMAFSKVFGWGVMLSAIPVLAYQGSITLGAHLLEPYLRDPRLVESISLTGGLLVFSIALVILELKKVALADYLPSLVYAPLFTWLWLRSP